MKYFSTEHKDNSPKQEMTDLDESTELPNVWAPIVIKKNKWTNTFEIPLEWVPIARCVLFERYNKFLNGEAKYTVSWTDETKEPVSPIDIDDDYNDIWNIKECLPKNLHQTKIRLNYDEKMITILTLYNTTGKFLVQGKNSSEWIESEFDVLVTQVNAVLGGKINIETGLDQLACLLVPHLKQTPARLNTAVETPLDDSTSAVTGSVDSYPATTSGENSLSNSKITFPVIKRKRNKSPKSTNAGRDKRKKSPENK